MANLHGFNASNVDPAVDFEPMPAGKYLAIITDSGMKATKNGSGSFLELTFQVIEGPYKNRLLWSRLNLDNQNKQAVEIARAQLSAICRAVGVMQPKDSIELHNLPLQITVKCKRREDTDEIVNEIRSYAKKEAAAGQPQQETTNTPPWARK
jgi:hypothetical protein